MFVMRFSCTFFQCSKVVLHDDRDVLVAEFLFAVVFVLSDLFLQVFERLVERIDVVSQQMRSHKILMVLWLL